MRSPTKFQVHHHRGMPPSYRHGVVGVTDKGMHTRASETLSEAWRPRRQEQQAARLCWTKSNALYRVVCLRLILIGERFFHNFQSLETIGDTYQYTEALCHYS